MWDEEAREEFGKVGSAMGNAGAQPGFKNFTYNGMKNNRSIKVTRTEDAREVTVEVDGAPHSTVQMNGRVATVNGNRVRSLADYIRDIVKGL